MPLPIETKVCQICSKEFSRKTSTGWSQWERQKSCSQKCYYEARRGGRGIYKGYWTGKRHTPEVCKRISETLKGKDFTRRKKDEDLSYFHKHKMLSLQHGKPLKCEFCGKQGETLNGRWTVEWAKKHGHQYTINANDYFPLCHKCHCIYDRPSLE